MRAHYIFALSSIANSHPQGVVYMANDEGDCTEVLRVSDPIKALLLRNEKDILVVLTDTMMLSQHAISPDGSLSLISEVESH